MERKVALRSIWRCLLVSVMCLVLLSVSGAPDAAAAESGASAVEPEFYWDSESSTFTLVYDGTETLEIDSSFFRTYATEIGAVGAPLSSSYLGTTSEPVEHFVLKGTGPVSLNGLGLIQGLVSFSAKDGNLVSVNGGVFFRSRTTLTSVDFGSNLIELDVYAFRSCSLIEDVDLTSCTSLTTIKCSNTSGLRNGPSGSFKLPASLKSINCQVFSGSDLTSVEFAPGTELEEVTATEQGGFIGAMSSLEKLVLPSSLGDYSGPLFDATATSNKATIYIPYDLEIPDGFFSGMSSAILTNRIGNIVVNCAPSADATNSSLSAEVKKVAEEKSVTLSVEYQLHQIGADMKCVVCGQLLSLVYEDLNSADSAYQAFVEEVSEGLNAAYAISFKDEDGNIVKDISFDDDVTTLNVQLPASLGDGSYVKIFAFSQETGDVSLVEINYWVEEGAISFEIDSLADAYVVAVMGNDSDEYLSDTGNPSDTENSDDAENPSDTENSGGTEDSSDTENSGDETEDLTDNPDDSSADQEDDATNDDEEDDGALLAVTGDLPQTGDNSLASYGLLGLIATLAACGGVFAYRNSKTTSTRDK